MTLDPDVAGELEAAIHAMLSPFSEVRFERWRRVVEERARDLTDADGSVLQLPVARPSAAGPADDATDSVRRRPDAGGSVRRGLPDDDAFPAAGEREIHDPVCMSAPVSADAEARLVVFCNRPRDRAWTDRAVDLLRATLPAFHTGVRSRWAFETQRAVDAHPLDAVRRPLLLCTDGGRVLHSNRALDDATAADPDGARLRGAMELLARRLARADDEEAPPPQRAEREVRTGGRLYRLRGEYIPGDFGGTAILISADPDPRPGPDERYRTEFGLTPREVDVARLIRRGLSNRDIAAELDISRYTVQNHVRSILGKLDVTSRAQVAATLQQATAEPEA